MTTQPNGIMKIKMCYPDIWTPYGLCGLQVPRIGVGEGRFRILSSKEVDRMHGAILVNYLREVALESWLRGVWSSNLDALSECL